MIGEDTQSQPRKRLEILAAQIKQASAMATNSPLTTHVLNTATGRPANNLHIKLHRMEGGQAMEIASGRTNTDGRLPELLTVDQFTAGTYMIRFETGEYFTNTATAVFYPYVEIVFNINAPKEHYHIPLLLSPYGYSTYRGS